MSNIKIAVAVELIHISSLIHDDIIDNATYRHNRKTIYAKYGSNIAIVLGDWLLACVYEFISICENKEIIQYIKDVMSNYNTEDREAVRQYVNAIISGSRKIKHLMIHVCGKELMNKLGIGIR